MSDKRKAPRSRTAGAQKYVNLNVNGQVHHLGIGKGVGRVDPTDTLSFTLRETLCLMGTKLSCDKGACGGCTVILDGKAVLSCGGSFGSKIMSWQVQCYAAALSKATAHPVRVSFSKEEHLAAFVLRPATRLDAKVGMKKDGTVTAVAATWLMGTGYYSMTTQTQVAVGCGEAMVAVRCKNWNVKPKIVCTNRSASGIVRGFGGQELKCALFPLLSRAMEVVLETPIDSHRFHAIGVGEIATSPGPSAVLMAVSNAVGTWMESYPVTPEKVLGALGNLPKGGAR